MKDTDRKTSGTAVVTGASSGIGQEIAKQLAWEGWRVLAVARRAERLQELAGQRDGRIIPCACDITTDDAPAAVFKAAENHFQGLDLLVNNAGVSWVSKLAEMPDNRLDAILNLNVRALMRMCRESVPLLSSSSRGQIINVSSVAAHVPMESLSAYCASKAAVNMFSRVLAKELAEQGIRVNVLSPTGTDTELFSVVGIEVEVDALVPADEMARMAILMTQFPDSVDVGEVVAKKRFAP
jgi:NADP-dependent 3-hydroxy acid dehydrogenase YdfG